MLKHFIVSLHNIVGFSVNDHAMPVRESYLQEVGLGVQLKLSVTLTNSSGVGMPPSFLSFEPYMYSQQQKRMLKDLSHMMLLSGNLVTSVPKVCVCVPVCVCACCVGGCWPCIIITLLLSIHCLLVN